MGLIVKVVYFVGVEVLFLFELVWFKIMDMLFVFEEIIVISCLFCF